MTVEDDIVLNNYHGGTSFIMHQDVLTSYRYSRILLTAHRLGIFAAVGSGYHPPSAICLKTGMNHDYGKRFIHVLKVMGFLEIKDGLYGLTEFSKRYFREGSPQYQGPALDFELKLERSWQTLEQVLVTGERVYSKEEKSPEEYGTSLDQYLKAMDNVAVIRAGELWDRFEPDRDSGLVLDAGAGSGAFLCGFLERHPSWNGMFCDLSDVVERAKTSPKISALKDRMDFRILNLLDEGQMDKALSSITAHIILVSNVIHCQGAEETNRMLKGLVKRLAPGGQLIIHDFFTDSGVRGAAYDLHMMLNTLNGRTYREDEITAMVEPSGLSKSLRLNLPSSSSALVFKKDVS